MNMGFSFRTGVSMMSGLLIFMLLSGCSKPPQLHDVVSFDLMEHLDEGDRPKQGQIFSLNLDNMGKLSRTLAFKISGFHTHETKGDCFVLSNGWAVKALPSHAYIDGDTLGSGGYECEGVLTIGNSRRLLLRELSNIEMMILGVYCLEQLKGRIEKRNAELKAVAEKRDTESDNNFFKSYAMVSIPGKGFRMGRTEVTQAQWEGVMGSTPSRFKGADRPVENVSWDDCQEFIKRLNGMSKNVKFRLPTADEWEYCCRADGKGDWDRLDPVYRNSYLGFRLVSQDL